MGNMIITVSRQYGSGGKTIAAMLAQKLGINCYSREILKMASEDSGINERLFGMSDEKLRHAGWYTFQSDELKLDYLDSLEFVKKCSSLRGWHLDPFQLKKRSITYLLELYRQTERIQEQIKQMRKER